MIVKNSEGRSHWWNYLIVPIQNFRAYRQFHSKVKNWGYNSIYEAYCHVFEVDPKETLSQIDQFLDSSEQEYKKLLREHIQYLRPSSVGEFPLEDSPDSICLTFQEKQRFYQGHWLSEKYRNANDT